MVLELINPNSSLFWPHLLKFLKYIHSKYGLPLARLLWWSDFNLTIFYLIFHEQSKFEHRNGRKYLNLTKRQEKWKFPQKCTLQTSYTMLDHLSTSDRAYIEFFLVWCPAWTIKIVAHGRIENCAKNHRSFELKFCSFVNNFEIGIVSCRVLNLK